MSNLINLVVFASYILEPFNDGGCVSPLIEFSNIVDISNNLLNKHFTDSSYFSLKL